MTKIDLFAVGGQSNASGRGDSSQSPNPATGTAIEYDADADSLVDPLDDPLNQNDWKTVEGSAWPSFCVEYYNLLSQPVCIVGSARGATSQEENADTDGYGTWDESGTLVDTLISRVNDATAKLEAEGYDPTFRGILWAQGERDAREIDNGVITKSGYKSAFETMLTRYRSEFGARMPFWIFETGYWDGNGDTTGFQQVRAAQQEVTKADDHVWMVSDKQKTFPDRGWTDGGLHYSQEGYNLMGEVGALNVAARVGPASIFRAKRGDTSANDSYIGAVAEPTVDTDSYRLRVHDGTTQGGVEIARESDL